VVNPDSAASDEQTLLLRFKASGDLEILGKVFSPYSGMLLGVCLKYLKDREDAKDAVMQVFEKLVSLLRAHEVTNFKSWLYVTTRNHCLMQIRAKKGKFKEDISSAVMENELLLHLDDEPELEENLVKLEGCISELVGEQRDCVRYFFLQELCYKDICTKTGFDMNKVKSYIQNGKRNLKLCMERNG
jgi:RNA polymerase sigma factor (sigma-70 family)